MIFSTYISLPNRSKSAKDNVKSPLGLQLEVVGALDFKSEDICSCTGGGLPSEKVGGDIFFYLLAAGEDPLLKEKQGWKLYTVLFLVILPWPCSCFGGASKEKGGSHQFAQLTSSYDAS